MITVALHGINLVSANDDSSPAEETVQQACKTIVSNPQVKGATQTECECVLEVFKQNVEPDFYAAEVAFFKEPDFKKGFKIEWDLAMSLPPHQFRKILNETSDKALQKCGTDMRHRRTTAGTQTKPAKPPAKNPVSASNAPKDSAGKNEVITDYDWPNWWARKTTASKAIAANGNKQSLRNKEVIYADKLFGGCKVYFRRFNDDDRYDRTITLKHIESKEDCNLDLPEVKMFSYDVMGATTSVSNEQALKGTEIKKDESIVNLPAGIPLFGQAIPGLKDTALANCDSETGICSTELAVAFWNEKDQHILSKHWMAIYQKATPLKSTPVKNSAKKLFPSGQIPAGTVLQKIHTTVSWISGGKFQSDSCNALWIGEDTSKKPDKLNWGCNGPGSKLISYEIDYLILD